MPCFKITLLNKIISSTGTGKQLEMVDIMLKIFDDIGKGFGESKLGAFIPQELSSALTIH